MKRILKIKEEIGNLSKNSRNPFFKTDYLNLNDLLDAVDPLLIKNGLLLLQPIIGNSVQSIIYDSKDGSEICMSSLDIPSSITDPQKIGSCITYFRRYTLKSLLAISEFDDDGNLASKPVKKEKKVLDAEGVAYLKDNIDKIPEALETREMTTDQRNYLKNLIK